MSVIDKMHVLLYNENYHFSVSFFFRDKMNFFPGQEELDEIQMRLDDDLENLKEERTRQSRLAATVTDEMYKDSQVSQMD